MRGLGGGILRVCECGVVCGVCVVLSLRIALVCF